MKWNKDFVLFLTKCFIFYKQVNNKKFTIYKYSNLIYFLTKVFIFFKQVNGNACNEVHMRYNELPQRTHNDPQYHVMIPSMASTPQVKGRLHSNSEDHMTYIWGS